MSFRLIYEMAAPREPDLKKVTRQIEIFGPIVDSIFVPDNHLGLPAMSSLAISLEILERGFKPIVGMNARDRNQLRLASDLITLKAYGIDEVMFLYGDPVKEGRSDLNVRRMLSDEAAKGFKRGVAAAIGKPLGWRGKADFFMTQLAFGRAGVGPWKEAIDLNKPLYCGVIALRDEAMARRVFEKIPELQPPSGYLDRFSNDGEAGFNAAIDEMDSLRESGIDGAQIVVPAGWKRFAKMLENWK